MAYTGDVTVGGPPDAREITGLTVTKLAVGPMDNNAYLLQCAQTGELVGDCVLMLRSKEHEQGEVGYVFNPAYHGRGYATEAVGALLRLGFEGLGLHRIAGHLDARNIASARVLERAGLRREAHLVENEFVKGEWADELIYAILRREWEARQAPG